MDITIPLAFRIVAESATQVEKRVRQACREAFREQRLLKRILPDIDTLLDVDEETLTAGEEADSDPAGAALVAAGMTNGQESRINAIALGVNRA